MGQIDYAAIATLGVIGWIVVRHKLLDQTLGQWVITAMILSLPLIGCYYLARWVFTALGIMRTI